MDFFLGDLEWILVCSLLFYIWVDDRKLLLRKPSSSFHFPILLAMALPGHLSDFHFFKRCASSLVPEVKNILQLNGILRLRSRPGVRKLGEIMFVQYVHLMEIALILMELEWI